MPKGYAEGPAAEEAERRREELESGPGEAPAETRVAVEGCTADDPNRHFLGWGDEVGPPTELPAGSQLAPPVAAGGPKGVGRRR